MLKFDNPPAHVSIDNSPNRLPILYSFNSLTGNFIFNGSEHLGNLVIQPLCFREKTVSRHGGIERFWLDVLFLDRFNRLGLISLHFLPGADLLDTFGNLLREKIELWGVWLRLSGHDFGLECPTSVRYRAIVNSYYWASKIDCLNAESKLRSIRLKPWEQSNGK
jgi:hypothetical protein